MRFNNFPNTSYLKTSYLNSTLQSVLVKISGCFRAVLIIQTCRKVCAIEIHIVRPDIRCARFLQYDIAERVVENKIYRRICFAFILKNYIAVSRIGRNFLNESRWIKFNRLVFY